MVGEKRTLILRGKCDGRGENCARSKRKMCLSRRNLSTVEERIPLGRRENCASSEKKKIVPIRRKNRGHLDRKLCSIRKKWCPMEENCVNRGEEIAPSWRQNCDRRGKKLRLVGEKTVPNLRENCNPMETKLCPVREKCSPNQGRK